jgi:hypothetical protein
VSCGFWLPGGATPAALHARMTRMAELMRTNDVALISVVEALLGEGGIPYQVADGHISTLEGSINMFQRRILVADGREGEARQLLVDAGLGEWAEG